jgi:hypothetical protein
MTPLQPVTKTHFKKALKICQQYVEGVSQPIVEITWLYKGNPILRKVHDRNTGATNFYAVSKSIEAKRKASMKTETIVLQVDGTTITGALKRTAHDIEVEITSPYRNLKSGLHIPYFARSKFSFTGEYGIERANVVLHSLYELGKCIEAQLPELRRMYAEAQLEIEAISKTGITYERFLKDRQMLRKALWAGEIDKRGYETALKNLKQHHDRFLAAVGECYSPIFTLLPVNFDQYQQVLEIVSGEKPLRE